MWVSMSHLPFPQPRLRVPGGGAQCGPQPPSWVCAGSYLCAPHETCGEQMHTSGSTHSGAHCSPDDPTHAYTCLSHTFAHSHSRPTVPSSPGPLPPALAPGLIPTPLVSPLLGGLSPHKGGGAHSLQSRMRGAPAQPWDLIGTVCSSKKQLTSLPFPLSFGAWKTPNIPRRESRPFITSWAQNTASQ